MSKKKQDREDLIALNLQERLSVTLPDPLIITLPLIVKLEDVKYKEVSIDPDIGGVVLPEITDLLLEKGMRRALNLIISNVEWEAVDIESLITQFYGEDFIKDLEVKTELKDGFKDYYTYDNTLNDIREKVIYNVTEELFNEMNKNKGFEHAIYDIVRQIQEVQERIITEFNEITEKLLTLKDTKTVVFDTAFLVMCKMAITRGLTIFPENEGLSTTELSYREIRIRIMFESIESAINTNRMVAFAPAMRGGF